MDETVEILEPENYLVTPAIRVRKVTRTGIQKVLLELVEPMVTDRQYQLKVESRT